MIQKSLEFPVYNRKKGGLRGRGDAYPNIESANYARTFEDVICEVFAGEIVQENSLFSNGLSDMTRRNLKKIQNS